MQGGVVPKIDDLRTEVLKKTHRFGSIMRFLERGNENVGLALLEELTPQERDHFVLYAGEQQKKNATKAAPLSRGDQSVNQGDQSDNKENAKSQPNIPRVRSKSF